MSRLIYFKSQNPKKNNNKKILFLKFIQASTFQNQYFIFELKYILIYLFIKTVYPIGNFFNNFIYFPYSYLYY